MQCPAGMICSASTCSNAPTEATTAPVTTTAAVTTTTTYHNHILRRDRLDPGRNWRVESVFRQRGNNLQWSVREYLHQQRQLRLMWKYLFGAFCYVL